MKPPDPNEHRRLGGRRRWEGLSEEERAAIARAGAEAATRNMTKAQRRKRAKIAAAARWKKRDGAAA